MMSVVCCCWYDNCTVPSEEEVEKGRIGQDARRTVFGGQGEGEVG